ncbi:hypothetical protein JRQ81_007805 [Phrynocephalus forsythii]|uniref:N-CoR GPS2-interacting domain-containing protein n=1 Tax=Phrynocephalus forsythii TaxID=171643 RepID=A0A9Q1ATL6_9SAUR|nr:hypothetical protein JRQ81_007805 [Phrynocephalus forsythii]
MSGSTQPVAPTWRGNEPRYPPHAMSFPVAVSQPHMDVGLLEYQHHPRDYPSHLPPGSILQPQRRRPSLLSEFQPGNERSQEMHSRSEPHSYLPDLSKQSELEFIETKRPRLELLQEPLLRHSPMLSQGQQGGMDDLAKDRSIAGKLEPVSPVSPVHPESELDLLPSRLSKEELIQNMDRVDREITMVEQQICKLRKKQVILSRTRRQRGKLASPVPVTDGVLPVWFCGITHCEQGLLFKPFDRAKLEQITLNGQLRPQAAEYLPLVRLAPRRPVTFAASLFRRDRPGKNLLSLLCGGKDPSALLRASSHVKTRPAKAREL